MYCNRCGHKNRQGSNFCSSCGAVLEIGPSDEPVTTQIIIAPNEAMGEAGDDELTVSLADVPRGCGILVVKRGPNAGSRFILGPGVTKIGRHPESDVFLDDVTVSRRHAEIRCDEGIFSVSDVGSLNGTYLNRERIEESELSAGDELQVGKFRLVFLAEVTGA